jgi:hypothetical protein
MSTQKSRVPCQKTRYPLTKINLPSNLNQNNKKHRIRSNFIHRNRLGCQTSTKIRINKKKAKAPLSSSHVVYVFFRCLFFVHFACCEREKRASVFVVYFISFCRESVGLEFLSEF